MNVENVTFFDSFRVEHIPKKIENSLEKKTNITNNYRIQAFNSRMCQYFCIGFIDFMLKRKSLLECINLFSPKEYNKNHKIILKYFS